MMHSAALMVLALDVVYAIPALAVVGVMIRTSMVTLARSSTALDSLNRVQNALATEFVKMEPVFARWDSAQLVAMA